MRRVQVPLVRGERLQAQAERIELPPQLIVLGQGSFQLLRLVRLQRTHQVAEQVLSHGPKILRKDCRAARLRSV